jgi:hypothetical protein
VIGHLWVDREPHTPYDHTSRSLARYQPNPAQENSYDCHQRI